jgi:hypothetical protein
LSWARPQNASSIKLLGRPASMPAVIFTPSSTDQASQRRGAIERVNRGKSIFVYAKER